MRKIPFRAHSGPARSTILEDIVLSLLIIELVERFGLKPTRYRDRKHSRPSACSIVARAATELGLRGGGEDAIRKVWKRAAPRMLPGYRLATAEALATLAPHAAG